MSLEDKKNKEQKVVHSEHSNANTSVLKELDEKLEAITPEQEEKAKKLYERFLSGDLKWAELWDIHAQELSVLAEQGYLKFKRGKLDDAEMIFKGLSVLDDQNPYYHTMLGAVYQKQEKWGDALAEYTIAVELNPQDITAYVNRGEIYYKMGYLEEPLEDFEKAIALDDTEKNPWAIRAKHLKEIVLREIHGA